MSEREVPPKVVDRIVKLLRLAGRGKTSEEKTARRIAENLMEEWSIDVDADEDDATDDRNETISFVVQADQLPWRNTLLLALTLVHDCTVNSTRDRRPNNPRFWMWIHGERIAVRHMRIHYNLLAGEIELLVGRMEPREQRHAYALGCARLVMTRLTADRDRRDRRDRRSQSRPAEKDEFYQGPGDDAAISPAEGALMRIPRRKVNARPPADPAPATIKINVDLPEHRQQQGYQRGLGSNLERWATRVPPIMLMPIASMRKIPTRVRTALQAWGINLMGELVALRESQLSELRGIGPKTIASVRRALHREGGYHLRPEEVFAVDKHEDDAATAAE